MAGCCGVFGGMQWMDLAGGDAGNAVDGFSEVIPTQHAIVGVVENVRLHALLDDGNDGGSQVASVGGSAHLVEHHADGGLLLAQPEHGLNEILAKRTVEPGCADNHRTAAELRYA